MPLDPTIAGPAVPGSAGPLPAKGALDPVGSGRVERNPVRRMLQRVLREVNQATLQQDGMGEARLLAKRKVKPEKARDLPPTYREATGQEPPSYDAAAAEKAPPAYRERASLRERLAEKKRDLAARLGHAHEDTLTERAQQSDASVRAFADTNPYAGTPIMVLHERQLRDAATKEGAAAVLPLPSGRPPTPTETRELSTKLQRFSHPIDASKPEPPLSRAERADLQGFTRKPLKTFTNSDGTFNFQSFFLSITADAQKSLALWLLLRNRARSLEGLLAIEAKKLQVTMTEFQKLFEGIMQTLKTVEAPANVPATIRQGFARNMTKQNNAFDVDLLDQLSGGDPQTQSAVEDGMRENFIRTMAGEQAKPIKQADRETGGEETYRTTREAQRAAEEARRPAGEKKKSAKEIQDEVREAYAEDNKRRGRTSPRSEILVAPYPGAPPEQAIPRRMLTFREIEGLPLADRERYVGKEAAAGWSDYVAKYEAFWNVAKDPANGLTAEHAPTIKIDEFSIYGRLHKARHNDWPGAAGMYRNDQARLRQAAEVAEAKGFPAYAQQLRDRADDLEPEAKKWEDTVQAGANTKVAGVSLMHDEDKFNDYMRTLSFFLPTRRSLEEKLAQAEERVLVGHPDGEEKDRILGNIQTLRQSLISMDERILENGIAAAPHVHSKSDRREARWRSGLESSTNNTQEGHATAAEIERQMGKLDVEVRSGSISAEDAKKKRAALEIQWRGAKQQVHSAAGVSPRYLESANELAYKLFDALQQDHQDNPHLSPKELGTRARELKKELEGVPANLAAARGELGRAEATSKTPDSDPRVKACRDKVAELEALADHLHEASRTRMLEHVRDRRRVIDAQLANVRHDLKRPEAPAEMQDEARASEARLLIEKATLDRADAFWRSSEAWGKPGMAPRVDFMNIRAHRTLRNEQPKSADRGPRVKLSRDTWFDGKPVDWTNAAEADAFRRANSKGITAILGDTSSNMRNDPSNAAFGAYQDRTFAEM
ncbi:MAG TPA: hypothetical protein VFH51_16075, partial [Myxococcota bacterium]|nr:hypothetical protein [Myxococcota bacterium]